MVRFFQSHLSIGIPSTIFNGTRNASGSDHHSVESINCSDGDVRGKLKTLTFTFAAVSTSARYHGSALASVTLSNCNSHARVPLFSIGSALDGGRPKSMGSRSGNAIRDDTSESEEMDEDSENQVEGQHGHGNSSSSGSSSSNPSSELGDSEVQQLRRIHCSSCHRPLVKKARDADTLRVCDGCHRCFHRACCRRRRMGFRPSVGSDLWFHSSECQESYEALHELCSKGAALLPNGRSLQLIEPAEASRVDNVYHQELRHVVSVLSDAYGPFAYQQVTGSDYGVLLRCQQAAAAAEVPELSKVSNLSDGDLSLLAQGPQASGSVAAATLDVYGLELAKIDLLATREDVRKQGHCRTLVTGLEEVLSELGVRSLLVVLSKEEQEVQDMWLNHFLGYKQLSGKQAAELRSQFPHFQMYDQRSSIFLKRQLKETSKSNNPGIVTTGPWRRVRRIMTAGLWR